MPRAPRVAEPEFTDPLENPEKANADIAAALADATSTNLPVIPVPPDDLVTLPGGLVLRDRLVTTAIVKELTGVDEESLARASQSLNPFHFLDRLLKCGVTQLGNEPANMTEKLLGQLLIGDREALILGIRRATYGESIDIEQWKCPVCATEATLSMELSDIPVTKMSDPEEETTFKVPMRKGGHAVVRLATGDDQVSIFEKPEISSAQRETKLLQRCVSALVDESGQEHMVPAFPSLILSMSIPDRHKILRELTKRQPGPKYDQVKYKCESCGEDVTVTVGIGDLFLDFGWV
jgi:hypothetical protein